MHLLETFRVMENYRSKGFHNIIANVFDVILEYTLMLLPNNFPQLETKLILNVGSLVQYQVSISVVVNLIFLIPSPEWFHG